MLSLFFAKVSSSMEVPARVAHALGTLSRIGLVVGRQVPTDCAVLDLHAARPPFNHKAAVPSKAGLVCPLKPRPGAVHPWRVWASLVVRGYGANSTPAANVSTTRLPSFAIHVGHHPSARRHPLTKPPIQRRHPITRSKPPYSTPPEKPPPPATMLFSAAGKLLLAGAALFQAASAHNIALPAHGRECFHETLRKGDKMTVTFQVGDREFGSAGNLDIDFWV